MLGCRGNTKKVWALTTGLAASAAFSASAIEPYDVLAHSVGPVQLRPYLELRETYDSNIFFRSETDVDDFITSINPGLNAFLGDPERNFLALDYRLSQAFYLDETRLNRTEHYVTLENAFNPGRVSIEGGHSVSALERILRASLQAERAKVSRLVQNHEYEAEVSLSPKTSVTGAGRYRDINYESGARRLDVVNWRGTGGFRYHLSPRVSLLSEAFYGQSFTRENQEREGDAPQSDSVGGFLGAIGEFTPKLTLQARIGYELREFEDGTSASDGLIGRLQGTHDITEKTQLSLSYSRRHSQSSQASRSSYSADNIDATLRKEFGSAGRWVGRLQPSFEFRDYQGNVFANRKDYYYTVSLAMEYHVRLWLRTGLEYEFERFESTSERLEDYNAHRVSLTVSVGYLTQP